MVLRTFLTAVSCWILFMGVDFAAFAMMPLPKDHPFQILPGMEVTAIILFCYIAAGVITAMASFMLMPVARHIVGNRTFVAEKLVLALALIFNSGINIFVLAKSHRVPLLGSGPFSVRIMMVTGIALFVAFIVTAGVPKLKKKLLVIVPSACLACELFWLFIRGAFLKGGVFRALTEGLHASVVFMIACMLLCAVFAVLYWLVPRTMARFGVCLLVAAVIVSVSPRIHAAGLEGRGKQANIVLIILDTLRADHLSCYGYHKKTTPNIDRFASESVKYTRAYSTASWTLPSLASILTGKYPKSHGAHRNKDKDSISPFNILTDRQRTLAEILRDRGYATAGIVSCQFATEHYGMHQGFDYFDDAMPSTLFIMPSFGLLSFFDHFFPVSDYFGVRGLNEHRVARQVNRSAQAWLTNTVARKPFFLLLHYFDVHHPYYPEKLGTSGIPLPIKKSYKNKSVNYADIEKRLVAAVQEGGKPLFDYEREYLVGNYDREIMLLDRKVGQVLDMLKKQNVYDDSLVIITSDHGESFGEHNLMLHGICLYEDNLHVPLFVKYPSNDSRTGVRDYPVSLTGILPTILSYLAIPVPEEVQGASFDNPEAQTIVAQNHRGPFISWPEQFRSDTISLLQGDYKYIRFFQTQDQFFNLREDPGEKNNIIKSEIVRSGALSQELAGVFERFSSPEAGGEDVEAAVDETTLENLRALGYID